MGYSFNHSHTPSGRHYLLSVAKFSVFLIPVVDSFFTDCRCTQPNRHFQVIISKAQHLVKHLTMRILLIAVACFICVAKSFGQTTTGRYGRIDVEITKEKKPKKIYAKVEIKSAFISGDSSWVKSIEKSINQSIKFKNGAKPGKYTVSAQFVVAKDSSISDVRCLEDPGFGMGAEVVRALKKGSTKWTPAPAGGIRVREYRH